MPAVRVDNLSIAYGLGQAQVDPQALCVVFIHGSGGDREDWRGQLDDARLTKWPLLAMELPGHGSSQGPGESSVAAYGRWVERFIETLNLRRVVLVGCSLGSAVVQWIALNERKPWLKGIGLVGAGASLKVHPDFLDGLKTNPEAALLNLAEFCLSKRTDARLHVVVNAKFAHAWPEMVHGDLTACNAFDIRDRVEAIDLPTFIVVGKEDRLTPVKYSKFLQERIQGSSLTVIPEAGHLVMLEKPTEFNEALKGFLETLGS